MPNPADISGVATAIRLDDLTDEHRRALRLAMDSTGQATSKKALLAVISAYPTLRRNNDDLRQELARVTADLEELKRQRAALRSSFRDVLGL